MAASIQYGLRWSVELVALPLGAGPMGVQDQQRLKVDQGAPSGGGIIAVTSTGNYPTSGNLTTALTTLGTNAAAALNTTANQNLWQNWYTGGG